MDRIVVLITDPDFVWLVITTALALGSGLLSSWLTYRYITRQQLLEEHQMQAEGERDERVRAELVKWSNDVIAAVDDLHARLGSVLYHNSYLALDPAFVRRADSMWSATYDYYMTSTLFLFGQFLGWLQLLREDVNIEIFDNAEENRSLASAMLNVSKSLGDFPLTHCMGRDAQLFRLQQRAIADLFIVDEGDEHRTLRYHEFTERMAKTEFAVHFQPLTEMLAGVRPDGDCRWQRLEHLYGSIARLQGICQTVLGHHRVASLSIDNPDM